MRAPALILAALLVGAGCSRPPGDRRAADGPPALQTEAASGPLAVRVAADHAEASPADRVRLSIEWHAPRGWSPAPAPLLPREGETIGGFTVAQVRRDPPRFDEEGRSVESRTFVLEPLTPGEYTIPALELGFRRAGGAPDASSAVEAPSEGTEEIALRTEPITITIRSLLDDEADAALAAAKGVVDAPPAPIWPWIGLGAGGVMVLGAAGALAFMLRRRSASVVAQPAPIPAHIEAMQSLTALIARRDIERAAFEPFFTDLSAILRRYIERRFDLHAPLLTTEEFLRDARSSPVFRAEHAGELARFLSLCDLVKFAAFRPEPADAHAAFDVAKAFVQATGLGDGSPTTERSAA